MAAIRRCILQFDYTYTRSCGVKTRRVYLDQSHKIPSHVNTGMS